MSALAARVDERLRAKRLNPRRAALTAGLGQDYVRDIMRGRVIEPSGAKLAALAEVLGCSTSWLLSGTDALGQTEGHSPPGPRFKRGPAPSAEGVSIVSTPNGRVRLTLNEDVSMGVAAQILALIEGDKT